MLEPVELTEIVQFVDQYREGDGAFEVVTYADLPGDATRAAELVAEWSAAGATWIHMGPSDFGMEPIETFRKRSSPRTAGTLDQQFQTHAEADCVARGEGMARIGQDAPAGIPWQPGSRSIKAPLR